MATFVHITLQSNEQAIRRGGLHLNRQGYMWCVPVMPNFFETHQWGREIAKWKPGRMIAVTFRVPDDTPALAGHFSERVWDHVETTAAGAHAIAREAALGVEVVFQQPLPRKCILRIKALASYVGWRHSPDAKDKRPCFCSICVRGVPNSQRQQRFSKYRA
jgi:hypothetical protein